MTASVVSSEGLKESNGKISYQEIDWDFIDLIARRMNQNKEKYPINNWKKPMDIQLLMDASLRHLRKMQQPIIDDTESFQKHLAAVCCNMMFINYQLK